MAANDSDSYSLVREGLDAIDTGDTVGAISLFSDAVATQPGNWPAHVNLFEALHIQYPDRAYAKRIKDAMVRMRQTLGKP